MEEHKLEIQLSNWLRSLQLSDDYVIVKEADLSRFYQIISSDIFEVISQKLPKFLDEEGTQVGTRAKYARKFWKIRKSSLFVGVSFLITACMSSNQLPSSLDLRSVFAWLADILGINALALTAFLLSLAEEQYIHLNEVEEIVHQNLQAKGTSEKRLFDIIMLHYPQISQEEYRKALDRLIDEGFLKIEKDEQNQRLITLNLKWKPLKIT